MCVCTIPDAEPHPATLSLPFSIHGILGLPGP
jgi:hypothetical protein